jgi:hypothetical protein
MKIVCIRPKGVHRKNMEGMRRMCEVAGHTLILAEEKDPIPMDAGLLWANSDPINPKVLPPTMKLLLGPGMFNVPEEKHPLFHHDYSQPPKKHVFNVLSPWCETMLREIIPNHTIPTACLPFPVNTEEFCPNPSVPKVYDILIYVKSRPPAHVLQLVERLLCTTYSWQIVHYGRYQESEYKELLQKSKMCIWLGSHESQGFALQECLAMNVPICVWDVKSWLDEFDTMSLSYRNQAYRDKFQALATTTPYFDERCGVICETFEDVIQGIQMILQNLSYYQPREYVLEHLSAKACWKRFEEALDLVPKE